MGNRQTGVSADLSAEGWCTGVVLGDAVSDADEGGTHEGAVVLVGPEAGVDGVVVGLGAGEFVGGFVVAGSWVPAGALLLGGLSARTGELGAATVGAAGTGTALGALSAGLLGGAPTGSSLSGTCETPPR